MTAFMTPFKDQVFALLRIAVGFNFLTHGTQKLFGFPGAAVEAPSFILNIAGPIELVGGALIMLGLFTRWTAFLCSGLMFFAYWMGHGLNHPFPAINQGELAMTYSLLFLYYAANGPGIWSVDRMRAAR